MNNNAPSRVKFLFERSGIRSYVRNDATGNDVYRRRNRKNRGRRRDKDPRLRHDENERNIIFPIRRGSFRNEIKKSSQIQLILESLPLHTHTHTRAHILRYSFREWEMKKEDKPGSKMNLRVNSQPTFKMGLYDGMKFII